MDKHRYEMAIESLEELRPVTMDTRLGGEVQFLLAETRFLQGKYAEADAGYSVYLDLYPDGPFAEKALYMNALSKIRSIRKIAFFTFRSYIPYDRDISVLKEARTLFELYIDRYPTGQWIDYSKQTAAELLLKEGKHELSIASFYLRKDEPKAVLARAEKILNGPYPEEVMAEAREMVRRAGDLPYPGADTFSP